MLAVLNRYRLLLVILLLIIMAVLIALYFALQSGGKTPSRGVFVMERNSSSYYTKGAGYFAAGNDNR